MVLGAEFLLLVGALRTICAFAISWQPVMRKRRAWANGPSLSPLVHHLCSRICTFRRGVGALLFPDISRQLGFLGFAYLWEINWAWTFLNLLIMNSYGEALANALIFGLLKWLVPPLFFPICREKLLVCLECWLCSEEDRWIESFWERRFWATWSPVVPREKGNSRCLPEWQDGVQGFNRLVTERAIIL